MLNDDRDILFISDYIHVIENKDGSFSVYINKSIKIKKYGIYRNIKDATKAARSIQKRRRLLIFYHDVNGNVYKVENPPLQAKNTGENSVVHQRQRKKNAKPKIKYA